MPFNKLMPAKKKSPKSALDKKGLVNGKLANSPRFRPKSKVNAVYECENSNKKSKSVFSKTTDSKNSDNEYSDIKTEDEEKPLQKPKPSMLWKKVSKNVEEETNKKEVKYRFFNYFMI
jgi:DUF438 domain-containing protein